MFQEIWCVFIVVEGGMALGELLDVKVAQLCGWFTVAFPLWWLKNQLRPATTSEVLAKQVLELRPVTKRKRELTADAEEQETPFVEDLMVPGVGQEEDQQPSYIDLPSEPGPAVGPQPAVPEDQETPQLPNQDETANDLQMMEDQEFIPVPVPLEQPESEAAPSRQMTEDLPEPPVRQVPQHPPGLGDGGLTAALRRSVDQLDGLPRPCYTLSQNNTIKVTSCKRSDTDPNSRG